MRARDITTPDATSASDAIINQPVVNRWFLPDTGAPEVKCRWGTDLRIVSVRWKRPQVIPGYERAGSIEASQKPVNLDSGKLCRFRIDASRFAARSNAEFDFG
jgi:hypothetical protein